MGTDAGYGSGPKARGDPRVGVFREGARQVRHPPIQACGASGSVAPTPSEYIHNLNEPLTCIVFVPIFLCARERYTTRRAGWLKIFV